ncbi:MAG: Uma2 family endonuclease [Gemmataceae bacterium]
MLAKKKRLGGSVSVNTDAGLVEIPEIVSRSHAAFRAWAMDNDLPEKTRVDFYRGKVWVDMGKEQIFSHALLKTVIAAVLLPLIDDEEVGFYSCNGLLLSNEDTGLSCNPDGVFVSTKTLDEGRVVVQEGVRSGFTEIVGTPDMILEVVSDSPVTKDKKEYRQAYWEAGISEYWLVDCHDDRHEFQIFKHTAKGYVETRKVSGWTRSEVFRKSFRLTRKIVRDGTPRFKLEVR